MTKTASTLAVGSCEGNVLHQSRYPENPAQEDTLEAGDVRIQQRGVVISRYAHKLAVNHNRIGYKGYSVSPLHMLECSFVGTGDY